ncbi:MAG: hypothetical protein ACREQY_21105 [Candidatus Binatia bacterium]
MRKRLRAGCAFVLMLATFGCGMLAAEPPPRAAGRAAPEPPILLPEDDDGEAPKPDDPAARKRHLAERFPGVAKLDLVKVMVWPEPRRGVCWSEMTPIAKTPVTVRSSEHGGTRREASGVADLAAQGWTKVYRAPQGEGVERRTSFDGVDLTLETELRCRCAPTTTETLEGDRRAVRLRLEWSKGKMPAISARETRDGRATGLTPAVTVGALANYEFSLRASFPGGHHGVCGAHVAVSLLVDPPIL